VSGGRWDGEGFLGLLLVGKVACHAMFGQAFRTSRQLLGEIALSWVYYLSNARGNWCVCVAWPVEIICHLGPLLLRCSDVCDKILRT
jgi:hypothetical protein